MIPVSTTNKTSGDDNNDKMLKKNLTVKQNETFLKWWVEVIVPLESQRKSK